MLADRGVEVDHITLFHGVQAYASTLERRIRRHLWPRNGSWRVDETYIKVKGVTVNPRGITVHKNPAYPRAVCDLKRTSGLRRFSRLRQRKYLNDLVEQNHRRIKSLARPGLGFGSPRAAKQTLAGYEAMAMIGKGQVHNVGGRDTKAQAAFVAGVFRVAA